MRILICSKCRHTGHIDIHKINIVEAQKEDCCYTCMTPNYPNNPVYEIVRGCE